MPHPQLNRAPIVEGLINIQIRPIVESTSSALAQLRDRLRVSYPTVAELYQTEFRIAGSSIPEPSAAASRIGYRLEKQPPPFVLLLQPNGLTVSRLAPYTNWEELVAEARPIWTAYANACAPEAITRIAARFINRVELPIAGLDFEDYLTASPRIPRGIPEILVQFMSRIVVPDSDTGADVAITQVLEAPNAQTGKVGLLIDIDVYKEVDFQPSADDIWQLLDKLRDLKNRAFFGSLTPKSLDLFR